MLTATAVPLDPLRQQLLVELGVVQYQPRVRGHAAPAVLPIHPPPSRQQSQPPQIAAAAAALTLQPGAGQRLVRFAGPASNWMVLRAHVLRALDAVESNGAADIMFGGSGQLLTLPTLGALAANPVLKAQAWAALRALRRAT